MATLERTRLAVLAAALAAGAVPWLAGTGGASIPAGVPTFSTPLDVSNAYAPCLPGAFKVYAGRQGRDHITVVEMHLADTRTFSWNGEDVACRAVEDSTFVRGVLHESSRAFFAQADDGSVYFFGEIVLERRPDDPPDSEDQDQEDCGWVVGAVAPEDPEGTVSATDPFLFMPATPALGDAWKPEDLAPVVDQSAEVVRAGISVRVPAGRFRDCIEVLERSGLAPGREIKWYAPGVGVLGGRSKFEFLRLQATTLRPR